jgi:hypothetical protein
VKITVKKPGKTIIENAYNRRVEVIFHDQGVDIIFVNQENDLHIESP